MASNELTLAVTESGFGALPPVEFGVFGLGHLAEVVCSVIESVMVDVVDDLTASDRIIEIGIRQVPDEMGTMNVTAGIDGGPLLSKVGWEPDHEVLVAAGAPGVVTASELGMVWTDSTLSGVDFWWNVAAFVAAGYRAEPWRLGSGVDTGELSTAYRACGGGLHGPDYSVEVGV